MAMHTSVAGLVQFGERFVLVCIAKTSVRITFRIRNGESCNAYGLYVLEAKDSSKPTTTKGRSFAYDYGIWNLLLSCDTNGHCSGHGACSNEILNLTYSEANERLGCIVRNPSFSNAHNRWPTKPSNNDKGSVAKGGKPHAN